MTYPERIRSVAIVAPVIGLVLIVRQVTMGFGRTARLVLASVILMIVCLCLPARIDATRFDHRAEELCSFLSMYCRPETQSVLILHQHQPIDFYLKRAFGPEHVAIWPNVLEQIFEDDLEKRMAQPRRWKRLGRALFFPTDIETTLAPEQIQVLVYVVDERWGPGSLAWDDARVNSIRSRLTRLTEFHHGIYRILIYESP